MRDDTELLSDVSSTFDRHWHRWTALIWLLSAIIMVAIRWKMIYWFSLPDTDDNMRLMQVRGLLNGQGWYDLRQYALNPPYGANIHWSRLVDLPIAALILIFKPLVGVATAERIACALAPTLPLCVAMLGMGAIVRRLVAPLAYPLAIFIMLCAVLAMSMFLPLRIDHHGWQLAFLVLTLAGMTDHQPLRGGLTVGLTSAASLNIGLEMIPFLALAGMALVLRWAVDGEERVRLRAFGLSLALGCALGYAAFASNDNRQIVCDVLSPVWLSVMVGAGALALLITFVPTQSALVRLGLAGVAGLIIAGGYIHYWPMCLARPERVSPEVYTIWLSNVSEAKSLLAKGNPVIITTLAIPFAGMLGTLMALWHARGTAKFARWCVIALLTLAAFGLTIWQTRMGPATELISVPGAAALGWMMILALSRSASPVVRVLGTVSTFFLITGVGAMVAVAAQMTFQPAKKEPAAKNISAQCSTLPAMAALNRLPAATIFTHVDLSPRLITLTHHRAIAGPYHRNGAQILDVYHAFGDTADQAHAIMARHGATLLLICPDLNETTVYKHNWPNGFYNRLIHGQVPHWLTPVALPASSPFKLWAIAPLSQETKS